MLTKDDIIKRVSEKVRLIRTEVGYTQEKMAETIGISKKTLVQIERGRVMANWPTVVTICALFRETEIIQFLLGDEPLEILETVARDGVDYRKGKTLGGKIWWRELKKENGFILQQNILSKHYRILDDEYYRVFSTTNEKVAFKRLFELIHEKHKLEEGN